LPDLIESELSQSDRDLRWRHLADCYLAQQLDCYPSDYLSPPVWQERILETVERFEEDLTDVARIHRPLKAVVQFGDAIEIDPSQKRRGDEELMTELEVRLQAMLSELQRECTPLNAETHPAEVTTQT
jgi:hypothetical protein